MSKKTITLLLMDAPFEQARVTTSFRIIEDALEKGHNVNIFTYEGGVSLSFAHQKPHGNAVHGRSVDEEEHPLTKEWISCLQEKAKEKNSTLNWINCGLCMDERGVNDAIEGCGRGGPANFLEWAKNSDGTLVIGTK